MDMQHAKTMIDAFYEAKRIWEQMPALPEGVVPSYIHLLDTITFLSGSGKPVRVSDVAAQRGIPRPGVTRAFSDMEKEGLVKKTKDSKDKRIVYVELTGKGRRIHQSYSVDYFQEMAEKLSGFSNQDVERLVAFVRGVREAL